MSHGMQVVGAAWRAAIRTMAGLGDLVQRTGDARTCRVLSGSSVPSYRNKYYFWFSRYSSK
jgi:hypothetical protein